MIALILLQLLRKLFYCNLFESCCSFSQTMIILGFCKLRGTHGGAAAYRDPARRAAATGATPVAGATHGGGGGGRQGEPRRLGPPPTAGGEC